MARMGSSKPGRLGSRWPSHNEKRSRLAPFFMQAEPIYLFLFAIMSWMIGARISSMAKPILAPGTTMVLRRDMNGRFGDVDRPDSTQSGRWRRLSWMTGVAQVVDV